ncbi:MAG: AAA family ATPase, partial [Chloroflexota bacterium]
MPEMSRETQNELLALLSPHHSDISNRKALFDEAFAMTEQARQLRGRVEFEGNARDYTTHLISTLHDHGEIEAGRETIWVYCEAVIDRSGEEDTARFLALYDAINLGIPITRDPETREPYKGLAYFTRDDADYYFGRTGTINRILTQLRQLPDDQRFLTVVGPSGSGKSSVVLAGVIPELLGDTNTNWIVLNRMAPGQTPIAALAATIASATGGDPVTIQNNLSNGDATILCTYVTQIVNLTERANTGVLLFVDQFEEVFTQTTDDDTRKHFIDLITNANCNGQLTAIITLRADFYGHPLAREQYSVLSDLIQAHQVNVKPMTARELLLAIEAPARKQGLWFESSLVRELLLAMQNEEGALPLLQFTLRRLYGTLE